jgi:hypothetical protein
MSNVRPDWRTLWARDPDLRPTRLVNGRIQHLEWLNEPGIEPRFFWADLERGKAAADEPRGVEDCEHAALYWLADWHGTVAIDMNVPGRVTVRLEEGGAGEGWRRHLTGPTLEAAIFDACEASMAERRK